MLTDARRCVPSIVAAFMSGVVVAPFLYPLILLPARYCLGHYSRHIILEIGPNPYKDFRLFYYLLITVPVAAPSAGVLWWFCQNRRPTTKTGLYWLLSGCAVLLLAYYPYACVELRFKWHLFFKGDIFLLSIAAMLVGIAGSHRAVRRELHDKRWFDFLFGLSIPLVVGFVFSPIAAKLAGALVIGPNYRPVLGYYCLHTFLSVMLLVAFMLIGVKSLLFRLRRSVMVMLLAFTLGIVSGGILYSLNLAFVAFRFPD